MTKEDAISRQAVLDALCNDCELCKNGEQVCFSKCEEYHFLATLPPVTPQKPICPSAGVDCKDCPAYEKKSEWQHDHEILKAYSDGAYEVLDKIRAEIENEQNPYLCIKVYGGFAGGYYDGLAKALKIIDKYIEGSDKE